MKTIMWGVHDIKDLYFNCCHSGLCYTFQRRICDRKKECLHQLCGDDERRIAGISIFDDVHYGDKSYKKLERAVAKWRKFSYKKCRPILMVIERYKQ